MDGKANRSGNAIQIMEEDTLMTNPGEVAAVFNVFHVNITKHIVPPTEDTFHMSNTEFAQHSGQ